MAFDRFWMVVNVAGAFDARGGEKIPERQAPRFLHPSKKSAEKELLRLQQKSTFAEFVLMEAIATAKPKVETIYVVEPITDPDVPF